MATAPSHIAVTFDPEALAATRREIRRILADARKANQELAQLEARCAALGIRLVVEGDRDE